MRIVVDLQACQFNSSLRGIGRYSFNLFQHMVRQAGTHDLIACLSDGRPEVLQRLHAEIAEFLPRENIRVWRSLPGTAVVYDRPDCRARWSYAQLLRESFLKRQRPDVLHTTSLFEGFGDDAVVAVRGHEGLAPKTAVTLYDLIPLTKPGDYLPTPLVRDWYHQKVDQYRSAALLLAISEHTREEAIRHLGVPGDSIVNISSGVDPRFRPALFEEGDAEAFRAKYRLPARFVLYTGGFDSRKNLERLIEAWAQLPAREGGQLAIAGFAEAVDRDRLAALAARYGLSGADVNFLGYVSDDDLIRLYSLTSLFVFPSTHEGFGLPILEAMACGAPVIASNATSLPEVVGREDATFDPFDVDAIASKLHQGLSDDAFERSLRQHAPQQAARFSWDESARRAIAALEMLHERIESTRTSRCRLALLCATASQHNAELKTALSSHYEVELISAKTDDSPTCRSLDWFEANARQFPRVLYRLEDAPGVGRLLGAMKRVPGVAAPDPAGLTSMVEGDDESDLAATPWYRELYQSYGYAPLANFYRSRDTSPSGLVARYRLSGQASDSALAVLVSPGDHRVPLIRRRGEQSPDWACVNWEQPKSAADECFRAIEDAYAYGSKALLMRQAAHAAALRKAGVGEPTDTAEFSNAAAVNHPRDIGARQILVDISILACGDHRTGIQRVVRRILRGLLLRRMPGWRIEPVYADDHGNYRYAVDYASRFLGLPLAPASDDLIDYRECDVFIGLDLAQHQVVRSRSMFEHMRRCGVRLHFVIFDLLPWLRPEFFPEEARFNFEGWLRTICALADDLVCISRSVADQLVANLRALVDPSTPTRPPLEIGYFHLGADIEADAMEQAMTDEEERLLDALPMQRTFLMVSTVEPRKAHAQVIEAFERLWHDKVDANLVIVGKRGWLVEQLADRLMNHPQAGERLFWIQSASDSLLLALYRRATAMLYASEGEGFGLPLIEAAQHGLAIVCRDLPVFREVAGEHAHYFTGYDGKGLADALRQWLDLHERGQAPSSRGVPWITWEESAAQLLDVVLDGRRYLDWHPGREYWFPAYSTRIGTQVGCLHRQVLGTTGEGGLLMYGPYVALERGRYLLRIHGRRSRPGSSWLELASERGERVLGRFELSTDQDPGGVLLETPFVLTADVHDLELRIWVSGDEIMTIAGYEILCGKNMRPSRTRVKPGEADPQLRRLPTDAQTVLKRLARSEIQDARTGGACA